MVSHATDKSASTPAGVSGSPGQALAHESASKHVSGKAMYIDDLPLPANTVYVSTGKSAIAAGRLIRLDLEAVRNSPGVIDTLVYSDIPGDADVSPVYEGDLLLVDQDISFLGQPLFAVAACSQEEAEAAVRVAVIEYEPIEPILTVSQAMAGQSFLLPSRCFRLNDLETGLQESEVQLSGELYIKGQEHFYLEGQISVAIPVEDGGVEIYTSSQNPSEIQSAAAGVLAISKHSVQVSVRRMGGAFGGKETQAAPLACIAALFAVRNGRAAKYRMPRKDDMIQTGKRHDFQSRYQVGFKTSGELTGTRVSLAALCGYSADLSEGIVDRAMFHADNAYFLSNAEITGYLCKTNTVSNTAFRGFGGPQGMLATEAMLDDIARRVNKDPLDVRLANLYGGSKQETPYGQQINESPVTDLVKQLERQCDYRRRRLEVSEFNARSSYQIKGLALTPVKFGISFTTTHLNQAGALLHIYTDGSIHLSHGGTEMGQGLHTKVAQLVAGCLGVSVGSINIGASRTDKVPNTSPTAASAGTDLNGLAAVDAAEKLKRRLATFARDYYSSDVMDICDDRVQLAETSIPFASFINEAYMQRVSLSATGYYKTPDIHFDKAKGKGAPFYYFAYGAACSEVLVDKLTGEYKITRVDILHDVGRSINPAVDIGQIEGGFIQGMGWLTTEELLWDGTGRLISNSPSNYKIPTAFDVPEQFNVNLYDADNPKPTAYRSKAVGEPPLMLAISVWCALRDACASLAGYSFSPPLAVPATPEQVYWSMQKARTHAMRSEVKNDD
ncbi:MAG: xanthine dehydrogenase molybdopterin binding subunit [Gammaproteobacteria bacterium]|jgi:xanthine dehydrogenase large subunit|nr:xanthine dehydrogenase molybdopterin binding subunit [Gammaproteobacteria bacterium]MBT5203572.1 xanthine dehydrogenase molybdopterin binding subunit [Gammaproteobacteria bacterium]MBT5601135.1 xanthine dehydrogenase molybdopterin binding subunit [Gammaproteobacteria bacterium]MBT6246963.1 xanthine dehydrogenase molybdopterin binding subunit [Gammaproteobacteria bacterium]